MLKIKISRKEIILLVMVYGWLLVSLLLQIDSLLKVLIRNTLFVVLSNIVLWVNLVLIFALPIIFVANFKRRSFCFYVIILALTGVCVSSMLNYKFLMIIAEV